MYAVMCQTQVSNNEGSVLYNIMRGYKCIIIIYLDYSTTLSLVYHTTIIHAGRYRAGAFHMTD